MRAIQATVTLSTVAPKWFSVTFDDCRRPGLLNRGSEQR